MKKQSLELDDYDENKYQLPNDDDPQNEEEEEEEQEDEEQENDNDYDQIDQEVDFHPKQQITSDLSSPGYNKDYTQKKDDAYYQSNESQQNRMGAVGQPLNSQTMQQLGSNRNQNQPMIRGIPNMRQNLNTISGATGTQGGPGLMGVNVSGGDANNINFHQHFNQPQVVNYTQNAFYGGTPNQYQQSLQNPSNFNHPSLPLTGPGLGQKYKESPKQLKSSKRPISAVMLQYSKRGPIGQFTDDKHQNYFAYNASSGITKQAVLNDFQNNNYRRKIIPRDMIYDKEDLYDQNILVKLQSNEVRDENTKLRTRLTMMQNQLKGKDKLIDDLYKSAFITSAGTQAKSNLNKDVLMLIKLKRQVYDLKDILMQKDHELIDLKKTLKSTKIRELEVEIKAIMQECLRLRGITENAIKLSGELDVERMKRERFEETQRYSEQFQIFQMQLKQSQNEIQRINNIYSQSQDDQKNLKQQINDLQEVIEQQKNEIDELIATNTKVIERKDKEIRKEKENVKEYKEEIGKLSKNLEQLQHQIAELQKKIPLRPEKEYIQEIEQKNQKIEELCDELLQKDTLIDKQAVLNKNMQKKVDSQTEQITELNKVQQQLQNDIQEEVRKNEDLENVIEDLNTKLKDQEDQYQGTLENLSANYEQQLKALNKQVEDKIQEKLRIQKEMNDEKERIQQELNEEKLKIQQELEEEKKKASMIDIVKRDHPAVVEGFVQLRKACLLNQIQLDNIQIFLFGNNYKAEDKVTVQSLSTTIEQKLLISNSEYRKYFSRYLIEPQEDDKIEINEDRTVAACNIIARIMNQLRGLKVYSQEQHEEAFNKLIQQVMSEEMIKQVEKLLHSFNPQITAKELARVFDFSGFKVSEIDVECIHLQLMKKADSIDLPQSSLILELLREALAQRLQKAEEEHVEEQKEHIDMNLEHDISHQNLDDHLDNNNNNEKAQSDHDKSQAQDANTLISNLLNNNLDIKGSYSKEKIQEIAEQAEQVFKKVSENLIESQSNARFLFEGKIYTINHPNTSKEIEVVLFSDLIELLALNNIHTLSKDQKDLLNMILINKDLSTSGVSQKEEFIIFDEVNKILKSCGIIEDIPKSKKGLFYEILDLKSKRIMNRLCIYLAEKAIPLNDFMSDIQIIQTVRTKTKTHKVEIVKGELLFSKLIKIGVRKSTSPHENLCKFLSIDPRYQNSLMVKKFKRALYDFASSSCLQAVGTKKLKYPKVIPSTIDFNVDDSIVKRSDHVSKKSSEMSEESKHDQINFNNNWSNDQGRNSVDQQEIEKIMQPPQDNQFKTLEIQGQEDPLAQKNLFEPTSDDKNEEDEEEEEYEDKYEESKEHIEEKITDSNLQGQSAQKQHQGFSPQKVEFESSMNDIPKPQNKSEIKIDSSVHKPHEEEKINDKFSFPVLPTKSSKPYQDKYGFDEAVDAESIKNEPEQSYYDDEDYDPEISQPAAKNQKKAVESGDEEF